MKRAEHTNYFEWKADATADGFVIQGPDKHKIYRAVDLQGYTRGEFDGAAKSGWVVMMRKTNPKKRASKKKGFEVVKWKDGYAVRDVVNNWIVWPNKDAPALSKNDALKFIGQSGSVERRTVKRGNIASMTKKVISKHKSYAVSAILKKDSAVSGWYTGLLSVDSDVKRSARWINKKLAETVCDNLNIKYPAFTWSVKEI